jgi:hypothetical protein
MERLVERFRSLRLTIANTVIFFVIPLDKLNSQNY